MGFNLHRAVCAGLLVCFLLTQGYAQASNGRWVLIATSLEGTKVYHDSTFKRLDNGDVLIWEKHIHTNGEYALYQAEIDCKNEIEQLITAVEYSKEGISKNSLTINERDRVWKQIIPESIGEIELNSICKYVNSPRRSTNNSETSTRSPENRQRESERQFDFSDAPNAPQSSANTETQKPLPDLSDLAIKPQHPTKPTSQLPTTPKYKPIFPAEDAGVDLAIITVNKANLREEPSISSSVVRQLSQGTIVVLVNREPIDSWYKVIDVDSSDEGWLHSSTIEIKLTNNKKPAPNLVERKTNNNENPYAVITNDADIILYLSVGDQRYTIPARSTKTIYLTPGNYKYHGSSPGLIPVFGERYFSAGSWYEWRFYVVTTHF